MKRIILITICFLLPLATYAKKPPVPKPELPAAERAFSEMAKSDGTRKAFLTFLDDSAVVFMPKPTNGKLLYGAMPESKTLLQWDPELSDIAYSGDFGYTTGSWRMSDSAGVAPAIFGHYLTVWKKNAEGKWRVVLDGGISHNKPDSGVSLLPGLGFDKITKAKLPKRNDDQASRSLRIADNIFATIVGKRGLVDAFRVTAAEDIRLLRQRTFPITGIDSAQVFLSTQPDKQTWKLLFCDTAPSGELGYTYGEISVPAQEHQIARHGYYIRVWRLDPQEVWRIAIDVTYYVKSEK